jgi:hypothetical protein
MRLKDPRTGRSAVRTLALACPIVMLLLTVLALVLFSVIEAGAGDQGSRAVGAEDLQDGRRDAISAGRDAAAGKERIAGSMLELMNRKGFDCERSVRLLLGIDEGAMIDNEQIVRLLLGIDESDDIDRRQIVELLEKLSEGEQVGDAFPHDRSIEN